MWLEVGRYAGSNSKLSSVGSDWDKCFLYQHNIIYNI